MTDETHNSGSDWPVDANGTPFQVVIRKSQPELTAETDIEFAEPDEDSFSLDEIEAAYLRALESADLAESQSLLELDPPAASDAEEEQGLRSAEEDNGPTDNSSRDSTGSISETPVEFPPQAENARDEGEESQVDPDLPLTSAEQVVEALLFVGGAPLPVKKFLDVLGGAHSVEQVEGMLEALNARYTAQRRPYEVRLIEGGYQLQLASNFEVVRARAYGHGPKEVRLAQDALEVLALIAYRQPVSREMLNEIGKPNLPGLLRQLLRRELICVDRSDPEQGECYRSMPRFLELFGLSSLDDLPQAGTFQFR